MKKTFLVAAIVLVSLAAIAFSQAPQAASWWGRVQINSTNSTNATVLADNGTGNLSTTVGAYTANLYLVDVGCSNGTSVKLRVFDLSAQNVTCSPGVKTELNLSASTASNGFVCNYAGSCTTGFCVDGYCCNSACGGADEACNVAGSLGTCTSTATASSGGGGGSSSVPPATLPSESQTVVGTIAAGGTADVNFAKSATLGVESIEITVNQQVSSVSVTVKETSAPSSSSGGVAISSSDGSVYKYLEITPTVSNDKISSAKVQFKVPKTWFDTNSIDPATVVLKKNVVAGWVDLLTTQTKFDGTYYYYESTTTGFSVYAVTGQKAQAAPGVPNVTQPEPGVQKPSISILSPSGGAVITGRSITLRLSASNVNLVPAGGAVTGAEGHFHVYLDGGQEQRGAQTEFRFENVSPGNHTIKAELHRNDHSQFDPPVAQEIRVTVKAEEVPTPVSGDAAFWAGAIILLIVVLGGYWYFTKKKK